MKEFIRKFFAIFSAVTTGLVFWAAIALVIIIPNPGPGLVLVSYAIWQGCERIAGAIKEE